MIEELRVKDFKIFDDITVQFSEGFNVITGETGAGKSMLIDSLDFLLGKRASSSVIKEGKKSCVVEAAFVVKNRELHKMIEEMGITLEGDRLIMRRIMDKDGKSRAYIMDSMVPVSTLKNVGERLVEITTQGGAVKLLNPSTHIDYLDAFAGTTDIALEVKKLVREIKKLEEEIRKEEEKMRERERRKDIIEFELKEIEEANLKEEEYSILMEKREMLKDAERVKEKFSMALHLLHEGEGSAYEKVTEVIKLLSPFSEKVTSLGRVLNNLESAREYLSDAVGEISNILFDLSSDPEELEKVEERITLIKKLMRKYGPEIKDILKYRDRIKEELLLLEGAEERIEELRKKVENLKEEVYAKSLELSKRRRKVNLAKKVEQILRELGIKEARFEVEFKEVEEGIRFRDRIIGETGLEKCTFLFSASAGFSPRPLHQVASGGELSRTLLAVKTTISMKEDVATSIYDEIDAGVGGNVGVVLGRKLSEQSQKNQVICITHLPQIAVFGRRHIVVEKVKNKVKVKQVEGEDRIYEITRMLGGEDKKSARKLAEEMLKSAISL